MGVKNISCLLIFLLLAVNISFSQSPYKLDYKNETLIGGTGILSAAAALILDSKVKSPSIEEINKLNSNGINWLDKGAIFNWSEDFSTASDVLVTIGAAAPVLLFASEKIRNDLFIISAMYLETMIYSFSLPYLAKGIVQRKRPFIYNNNAPLEEKLSADVNKSFFSGHTTFAFSSAVFLSTVYSDYFPDSKYKPYIWAGSLLIAAATGYSRYEAGKHFPTDIITGAIVGSAIGYLIPLIHKQNTEHVNINAMPTNRSLALSFSYRF